MWMLLLVRGARFMKSWMMISVAVRTNECEGRLFFGNDALPMLRAALLGDAWFSGPVWDSEGAARPGVTRARPAS